MKRISHTEYLAAKDAYLARLLVIVDCMIADEEGHRNMTNPPAKSEVSLGDPLGAQPREGDSLEGTLNANLLPCMLPFEDIPRDLSHKSHPYCD